MGYFLCGFIIAWLWCSSYTHKMIALECERLGGFFLNDKTYKCHLIVDHSQDTLTPQVIVDAKRRSNDEVQ
ncbi:hypothetical protein WCE00_01620 [Acinetobacter haemolyticus]|uniref:hypothetical protein n=1 Tax=Acinetobacter haemolyticus TaxID=29430 RepID=UPI0034D3D296